MYLVINFKLLWCKSRPIRWYLRIYRLDCLERVKNGAKNEMMEYGGGDDYDIFGYRGHHFQYR